MNFKDSQLVLVDYRPLFGIGGVAQNLLMKVCAVDFEKRMFNLSPYETSNFKEDIPCFQNIPFDVDVGVLKLKTLSDLEAEEVIGRKRKERFEEYRKAILTKRYLEKRYGFSMQDIPQDDKMLAEYPSVVSLRQKRPRK